MRARTRLARDGADSETNEVALFALACMNTKKFTGKIAARTAQPRPPAPELPSAHYQARRLPSQGREQGRGARALRKMVQGGFRVIPHGPADFPTGFFRAKARSNDLSVCVSRDPGLH